MKKEKIELSVGSQLFWGNLIPGIMWLGAGITGMFTSAFFQILHLILLVAVIILAVMLMRAKCEEQDEMAAYNLMKAKAKTRDIMHMTYCVASLAAAGGFGILMIFGEEMSLPRIVARMFFVLMGVQDILTSVLFHKLEAE